MTEDNLIKKLLAKTSHPELYELALDRFDLTLTDVLLIRDLCSYAVDDSQELHCLLILLSHAINNGSLCVNMKSAKTASFFKLFSLKVSKVEDFLKGEWSAIAGIAPDESKPLVVRGNLIYFQKYYKAEKELNHDFSKTLTGEISISDFAPVLENVLQSLPYKLHPLQVQGVLCALLKNFSIISGGPGTGKTSVVVALLRCLVKLEGRDFINSIRMAAPTGRAAMRLTESVHSAVKQLKEADQNDLELLKLEASTIHSLLKLYPGKKRSSGKLNLEVLIIDEVSMVDALLMSQLMESLPENCRVIFLGDRHQLPSVDAGAVLTDLIPLEEGTFSEEFKKELLEVVPEEWKELEALIQVTDKPGPLTDRITHLQHSYRSENSILKFSQAINDFDETLLAKYLNNNSLCLKKGSADEDLSDLPLFENQSADDAEDIIWPDFSADKNQFENGGIHFNWNESVDDSFLLSWCQQVFENSFLNDVSYLESIEKAQKLNFEALNKPESHKLMQSLFRCAESSRILCLTRQGNSGVNHINQMISHWLRRKISAHHESQFFNGCQIMITRNDKSRRLYNGDLGIIIETGNTTRAVFARQGKFVSFPAESLHDVEYAFAITVHKSQGSEYERVLLMLPESVDNRILNREILYTGVTRAKALAIICGSKEVFMTAVSRKIERVSGLSLWQDS